MSSCSSEVKVICILPNNDPGRVTTAA